jgi:hypothetical protein
MVYGIYGKNPFMLLYKPGLVVDPYGWIEKNYGQLLEKVFHIEF